MNSVAECLIALAKDQFHREDEELLRKAAATIARLEAENARLREHFNSAPAIDRRQKDSAPYLREYARRVEDWQREGFRIALAPYGGDA